MPEARRLDGRNLRHLRAGSPQAYLFAIFCVGVAGLLCWAIGLVVAPVLPFPAFLAAIVFASLIGGLGPGAVAAVLGLLIGWLMRSGAFVPVHGGEIVNFAGHLGSVALIAWVAGRYRELADQLQSQGELHSIVVEELRHRLKNKVSTVQAVIALHLREDPTRRDDILRALAAVNAADNLVTAGDCKGARLADIVKEELAPYDLSRATVSGPDIRMPARLATTMALVLHELATNAAKYGALSTCSGRIAVEWTVSARGLRFTWRESAGPKVTAPTRQGFGTRLLMRALEPFGGRLEAEFPPAGFRCEIHVPL